MLELKSVKLFQGLPDKELQHIANEAREVSQPAGKQLAVVGDNGVGFMVILEGEVEVTTLDGRVHVLGAGDHFGEIALLDGGGRSADVKARTDVRLAAIPSWGFKGFLIAHPEVTYRLLETASRRLREAEGG